MMLCAVTSLATTVGLFIVFVELRVSGVDPCQGNVACGNGTKCLATGDHLDDYKCECKTGFQNITKDVNQPFTCIDENECIIKSPCSFIEECVNTYGGYRCNCEKGYAVKSGTCSDIDECADKEACGTGTCNNTYGSYACECEDGGVIQGTPCKDKTFRTIIVAVTMGVVGLLVLLLVLGGLIRASRRKPRAVQPLCTLSSLQRVVRTSEPENGDGRLPDTGIRYMLKEKYTIPSQ
ncbi:adhesion G protein-coupled receptor E1-like [Liolophura sinensis]|uniref:adhesion G protein-coupled receptor E1-like n=1 Tax=Liolophura sinensis TaxID=3198878 RepID=UPI003159153B